MICNFYIGKVLICNFYIDKVVICNFCIGKTKLIISTFYIVPGQQLAKKVFVKI